MAVKNWTFILLTAIFLFAGFLFGSDANNVEDVQTDPSQEAVEEIYSYYCENSTATYQLIRIPNCKGRFVICSFSSIVIEHPSDCDLPDLYCVIGAGQDGMSCVDLDIWRASR